MKMLVRRLISTAFTSQLVVLAACVGSSPSGGGSEPEAAAAPTSSSPAEAAPAETAAPDAAPSPLAEQDGGVVSEPGGDPDEEPEGGTVVVVGVDGGADGGACGPGAGNGAAVASTCSSNATLALGGAIMNGTYDLDSFAVLGNATFCGSYEAVEYAGRLDVVPRKGGGFILHERVQRAGVLLGSKTPPEKSFEATVAGASLSLVQTCGAQMDDATWSFSVSSVSGKPSITYVHDQGSATVRYRWVMR